jgi:hypothetical protein
MGNSPLFLTILLISAALTPKLGSFSTPISSPNFAARSVACASSSFSSLSFSVSSANSVELLAASVELPVSSVELSDVVLFLFSSIRSSRDSAII